MKLPIVKAIGDTFGFFFGNYLGVLKVVLIPAAVLTALNYWLTVKILPGWLLIAGSADKTDPFRVLHQTAPIMQWGAIGFVAALVFFPMIYAGLLRFVVRGEKPGALYLRFGHDELGELLTFIVLILLWIGIAIVFGIIFGVAGVAARAYVSQSSYVSYAALLLALIGFVLAIWIALRLSLSFAASIGVKGIGIGRSWSATKGAAWSLFFYWVLWLILIGIVSYAYYLFVLPGYFDGVGDFLKTVQTSAHDPEAMRAAAQQWQSLMLSRLEAHWPLIAAGTFLHYVVILPLFIIAGGTAYKLLASSDGETERA